MVFDITCYYWTMKTPWFPSPSTQVWYKVMVGSQSQLLDKLSRALHTRALRAAPSSSLSLFFQSLNCVSVLSHSQFPPPGTLILTLPSAWNTPPAHFRTRFTLQVFCLGCNDFYQETSCFSTLYSVIHLNFSPHSKYACLITFYVWEYVTEICRFYVQPCLDIVVLGNEH